MLVDEIKAPIMDVNQAKAHHISIYKELLDAAEKSEYKAEEIEEAIEFLLSNVQVEIYFSDERVENQDESDLPFIEVPNAEVFTREEILILCA